MLIPVNGNVPVAAATARTVIDVDSTRADPPGASPSATRVCAPDSDDGIVTESLNAPDALAVSASNCVGDEYTPITMFAFGANPLPEIVTGAPAVSVVDPPADGSTNGAFADGGDADNDGTPNAEHTNTAVARHTPLSGLP